MSDTETLLTELTAARRALLQRRAAITDPTERAAIDEAVADINAAMDLVALSGLLGAAQAISVAVDALESVLASAHTRPFEDAFIAIVNHFRNLENMATGAHHAESLLPAPAPKPAAGAAKPAPADAPAGGVIRKTDFTSLAAEYRADYDAFVVRPERQQNVEYYLQRVTKGREAYQAAGGPLGVPWYFIGIVHGMEAGFNFQTHLHNGDPLSARTTRIPAGHPREGEPPFAWHVSARDALQLHRLGAVTEWSIPRMLYELERYNGFGYRNRGLRSPYLWSFSTLYERGKFVKDGKFDPNAVSAQCGAALILRAGKQAGDF